MKNYLPTKDTCKGTKIDFPTVQDICLTYRYNFVHPYISNVIFQIPLYIESDVCMIIIL